MSKALSMCPQALEIKYGDSLKFPRVRGHYITERLLLCERCHHRMGEVFIAAILPVAGRTPALPGTSSIVFLGNTMLLFHKYLRTCGEGFR